MPRYRVTTFHRPRAPWRETWADAMRDTRRLRLTSYDHERNEYFLAVPVEIEVERVDERGKASSSFTQTAPADQRPPSAAK